MSLTAITALLLQGVAVVLLRQCLGPGWFARPFSLLVVMAVVYHGITEVLLSFDSVARWDLPRLYGPPQEAIDAGMFVVSLGLLGLVAGYLLARPAATSVPTSQERETVTRVIDWRLAAAAAGVLLVLTAQGRGYITDTAYNASTSGLSMGLAQTFLIPTLVLAGFGFVLRHGRAWFVPVLGVQTVLLTLTGQRLEIFVAAAALVVLLARTGASPRRREVVAVLLVTGVLAVAITSVRGSAGRDLYYTDTGVTARLAAVAEALPRAFSGGDSTTDGPGLVAQAAARFDANVYAGAVQHQFDSGDSPLGVGLVARSLMQPIPSVLYPSKLSGPIWEREPENAAVFVLGVPNTDYLPGFVGVYLVALGWWLPVLMLLCGWVFGRAERWTLARFTSARVVVLTGLTIGAMFYERGVPGFLIQARAIVPLCLVVLALGAGLPTITRPRARARSRVTRA